MNQIAFVARLLAKQRHQQFFNACIIVGVSVATFPQRIQAQTVQPQSTAASTPVATPTVTPSPTPVTIPAPSPTATPVYSPTPMPTVTPVATPTATPSGTPRLTITPGVPSAAQIEAYNAARTPQVAVTLGTAITPVGETVSAIQPKITNGACALITLRPAAATGSKASRAAAASTELQGQPLATVVLTYPAGNAGQTVWVQATHGGTLTATDDAGQTYDGSQGFFLTLNASGAAAFSYQAPDASGTYQVFTRFSNVVTALPFLVPDLAP